MRCTVLTVFVCLALTKGSLQTGFAAAGQPRTMQGPVIGFTTPETVAVWARLSGPFSFEVLYDEQPDFQSPRKTPPLRASKEEDYVVVASLRNLLPATRYYYKILVGGEEDKYLKGLAPFAVKTAPVGPAQFRVAFGSCARIQEDPRQRIWSAVQEWTPDLFFWLGDNIYGDSDDPDILAEEYRRQLSVPSLRHLLRSVPQLAIYDDHDFGLNDSDRSSPVKGDALGIFKRYWANPGYGVKQAPGVFFHYSYGGVDFFFLDVRYYRDPNEQDDGPQKTMLGAAQLEWLRSRLLESQAPFKLLISGSGWSKAKGAGEDSWASYPHERNLLFEFIRQNGVSGVVLLSGDTHVGELNAIAWSEKGGYDFYELVSSPLAQRPQSSWLRRRPELRIRQVYNGSPNAGILDFDLTGAPRLTFQLIDIYGRSVWAPLELRADELVNGKATWREKMDRLSRERHGNESQGKDYYHLPDQPK